MNSIKQYFKTNKQITSTYNNTDESSFTIHGKYTSYINEELIYR